MSTLQQERRSSPTCARCGCAQALTIDMTVGKTGPQVSLTSCPRCEHRAWTGSDGVIDRADVLNVLSGRADFTFVPNERAARRRG